MKEQESSYRGIMKATSIFGGVQVFSIILSIIRSKLIALFLGASGMGTIGLLSSTIGLISGVTNFGLGTSAIRDVSAANSSGDNNRIETVVNVLKYWVSVTGAMGTILIVILAPILSEITFNNSGYVWSFVVISITVFFNQLNVGNLAILQGLQKFRYLAKSSLFGNLFGLIVNVPIFYFLGTRGVELVLIITSLITFLNSRYFIQKVKIPTVSIKHSTRIFEGKKMLKLGFLINLGGLFITFTTYALQLFISKIGSVSDVGLFTAGFAIINTYVGMIFTAMSTDYFPRLSSISESNEKCRNMINQQAEISILLLGPIIIMFLVFVKWIIVLLYSENFVNIEVMLIWLALAMFFKAASWAIGFILLAKGMSKLFFWNDFLASSYLLTLEMLGYYIGGLSGIGIGFFIGYILFLVQIYFLSSVLFKFKYYISFWKIFLIQFGLALICLVIMIYTATIYSYTICGVFILCSLCHSYFQLDKRIGIKDILEKINLKLKYKSTRG